VLPDGYRSGVITAITVLLGFSFLFLRSWAFELPGDWTVSSVMAGVLLAIAILLELVALWRALQLKDDDAAEYRLTLRWFLVSIIMLLVSLVTAAVSYALAPSS
jgi:cadmium resistance protein CadD (predicted permease)